jgi:hypothetical protein
MSTAWKRWLGGGVEASWTLAADETRRLEGGRPGPVVVRVQRGVLLVTREGDLVDHVVSAGQEVLLPARGRIAAWALSPAQASVASVRARSGGVAAHRPLPVLTGPAAPPRLPARGWRPRR